MQNLRPHQDLLSQDLFTNNSQAISLQREWYIHPYPVYNCNCFISSEPVLHARLFHLHVYACMHACMYVYFNNRRKLVFLQLHRLIAQNGYNMLPPTPRELYGGGAFALTRGTQSLRLSREAVTRGSLHHPLRTAG